MLSLSADFKRLNGFSWYRGAAAIRTRLRETPLKRNASGGPKPAIDPSAYPFEIR
jgi:hypothetical protein